MMPWLKPSLLVLSLLAAGCDSGADFAGAGMPTAPKAKARGNGDQVGADDSGSPFGEQEGDDAGGMDGTRGEGADGSQGDKNGLPGADASAGMGQSAEPAVGSEGNRSDGSFAVPVSFYCSEKTSENVMTTTMLANGVTFKLYDLNGRVVAEDNDPKRAAERRQDIISAKASLLKLPSMLTGEYYAAFCDITFHASCRLLPDDRMNPLQIGDGEGMPGFLGQVSMMKISGGKLVSASKGQALFALPTTPAEKALCDKTVSPLVIDLAGQGFSFTSIRNGVHFDLNADGTAERAAWPATPKNAFLVLDLNQDGKISSGFELFGNYSAQPDGFKSANGFQSLAKYDENKDDRIDQLDPIFSKLRLWQDVNVNGETEKGELIDLFTAGISTIGLGYKDVLRIDAHGNEIRQISRVIFEKAGRRWSRPIADAWLLTSEPVRSLAWLNRYP